MTFKGVDWSQSLLRPGCQDAFKCPSRRGDRLFEYREPYINSSSVLEKAEHLDRKEQQK
jgi:hypothetical protein